MNARGFTLIELVISIFIIGTAIVAFYSIVERSSQFLGRSSGTVRVQHQLRENIAYFKGHGFWIWDGNNATSYSAAHPLTKWQNWLNSTGYTGTATVSTIFLKEESGSWVPFEDNKRFDGHHPRQVVQVTVTLEDRNSHNHSASTIMSSIPDIQSLENQMSIIRQALTRYIAAKSEIPADLSKLVGLYLEEIPSDPFTSSMIKAYKTEEITDWHYSKTSSSWTLRPNSHRSLVLTGTL